MKYYKIYHYSYRAELTCIDPKYYGACATLGAECRRGKEGLNKSYFYTKDEPEDCVSCHATRYEIYLPAEWKALIYDLSKDPENLYKKATDKLVSTGAYTKDFLPDKILWATVEPLIKEHGYKGFTNSSHSILPHVITLFYPLSTLSPEGSYSVYDWADKIIEDVVCDESDPSYQSFHIQKCHTDFDKLPLSKIVLLKKYQLTVEQVLNSNLSKCHILALNQGYAFQDICDLTPEIISILLRGDISLENAKKCVGLPWAERSKFFRSDFDAEKQCVL